MCGDGQADPRRGRRQADDPKVVAIVPAHNEAGSIRATLDSLREQTVAPDGIYVVLDNCTDETAARAIGAGATVHATVGNVAKKAGALNQGLAYVMPMLAPEDCLLLVDADSVLCPEWIEEGVAALRREPSVGAVSGAYVARRGKGLVTLLQRAEYAQERRRISRRGGRVDVLSGTATLVPVQIMRQLVEARGYAYDETALTEDFEVTLAIKALGYHPRCYKQLRVVTDVMETWGDLARQRIRWQRGTIETLQSYGWTGRTRRLWLTQGLAYASTLVTLMLVTAWTCTIALGAQPDLRWLAIVPIFVVEQAVATRRAGWAPTLLAGLLVPMWVYDTFRVWIYWTALTRSLRRTDAVWS